MSDLNKIKAKLSEKSTEQLLKIWEENNRNEWSDEAFNAIKDILIEREIDIPEQTPFFPQKELPISWLKFYIYVRIPLGILLSIGSISEIIDNLDRINLPFLYLTLISANIILGTTLFIGLHKRQLWGWKLNWFSLIFEVFALPITRSNNFNEYFIMSGLLMVIWFLPNFVYFKKRKYLFESILPKEIECINCKELIELDEEERNNKQFICPSCKYMISFNS